MDGWCMDRDLNNNCVRIHVRGIRMRLTWDGWISLTIRRYFSQRLTRENNHFSPNGIWKDLSDKKKNNA